MYDSVAIIGISFELPGIKTWAQLSQSLKGKKTEIVPLSSERLKDVHAQFGPIEMAQGGYLDRIDLFDPAYFNFTKREAVKLFPEHRIFLMNAIRAFHDAGYTEEHLHGSDTGVFLARAAIPQYLNYLGDQVDFLDLLPGIEGTHLANFLDLRGPVITIDTTCSSSLVAIHKACLSLHAGESNMILVGGTKIGPISKARQMNTVVISNQGQCRAFDNDADGMINGEGCICMVLKRLEDAQRDNDPIYGVIKGSAVNHGGARISSLTAPSADAQRDVILAAWDAADIDPRHIQFIEAHGSGTILGDPIEIHGIQEAFRQKNIQDGYCGVSSFKDQVGHLDIMSGSAGLLRLLAAMHQGVMPAQANLRQLNELIDEQSGRARIQREAAAWEALHGRRLGGVSSFGLTGTNIHLIVSATDQVATGHVVSNPCFMQLSAASADRLTEKKKQLIQFVKAHPEQDLQQLSQKVNRLFRPLTEREGLVFSDREQLLAALQRSGTGLPKPEAVLLMDMDLLEYMVSEVSTVLKENELIRHQWHQDIGPKYDLPDLASAKVLSPLFQYVLYRYLIKVTNNELRVITRQGGSILQDLLRGNLLPETLIAEPERLSSNTRPFDYDKFQQYLEKTYSDQKVVLLEFSRQSLQSKLDSKLNVTYLNGLFSSSSRYCFYQEALAAGRTPLQVENVAGVLPGLQLPVFQLERFWPNTTIVQQEMTAPQAVSQTTDVPEAIELDADQLKALIKPIWINILELEADISYTDDFFDLGGDSLSALDMLSDVENEIPGVQVPYEQMFKHSTIVQLADFIHAQLSQTSLAATSREEQRPETSDGRIAQYEQLLADVSAATLHAHIPEKVLVTGSTGLLGRHFVRQIAQSTNAEVICLVRAEEQAAGISKLWQGFDQSFRDNYRDRITIIAGNLEDEHFYRPHSKALQGVDCIFHLAGSAAFTSRVSPEEHINFIGTKNTVDWARTAGIKNYCLISTIGVIGKQMPAHITNFFETDLNVGQQAEELIHASSKILAEEYLRQHLPDGFKIFRIPNIGGRYQDGAIYTDLKRNLMYLRLQSLFQLHAYSEEVLDHKPGILLAPVDILVQLMLSLAWVKEMPLRTFHLNIESGFTVGEIVDAFRRHDLYFEKLPHETLLQRLTHSDDGTKTFKSYAVKLAGSSEEHPFNFRNDATRIVLDRLDIPALKHYDRLQYLEHIISFCLTEEFLKDPEYQD